MVSVNQHTLHRSRSSLGGKRLVMAIGGVVALCLGGRFLFMGASLTEDQQLSSASVASVSKEEGSQLRGERISRPNRPQSVKVVLDESLWTKDSVDEGRKEETTENRQEKDLEKSKEDASQKSCVYRKLQQVSNEELFPQKDERHMVEPPVGGKISLVCCDTTVGPLNILAHHKWAPYGAKRFLDMVTTGYFDSSVPFMRCINGFLCQFGLNADNSKAKDFGSTIEDDPNWLPEGPTGRENEDGVKRFAQGYLAYAGSGKHSRSKQLIVSLKANGPLAGGSPWEVPWGEIVHQESFDTLSKIYTGYGEKGPPQGRLGPKGMTAEMRLEWPKLDYIKSCRLMDENTFAEQIATAKRRQR